jgi:Leucine-rich repeat (LRR) protein
VPDDLGRGVKLQRLLLKGNVIELNTAFWFENLTSLVQLDISDNQITALPVTIGMLTQLQVLRVEGALLSCSPPPMA